MDTQPLDVTLDAHLCVPFYWLCMKECYYWVKSYDMFSSHKTVINLYPLAVHLQSVFNVFIVLQQGIHNPRQGAHSVPAGVHTFPEGYLYPRWHLHAIFTPTQQCTPTQAVHTQCPEQGIYIALSSPGHLSSFWVVSVFFPIDLCFVSILWAVTLVLQIFYSVVCLFT